MYGRYSIIILTLVLWLPLQAQITTIPDLYIGGGSPGSGTWHDVDRIGDGDKFEIYNMQVQTIGSTMRFDIYTSYFNNIGALSTQLGDLFISTNGWSPYGTQPYVDDDFTTAGEKWEFGLALDKHHNFPGSGNTSGAIGGKLGLYQLFDSGSALNPTFNMGNYASRVSLSQAMTSGGIFRHNQEVQVNTGASFVNAYSDIGDWSIDATRQFLRLDLYNYTNYFGSASNFGVHWGFSCGNDVIEGSFTVVPEPSTVLLLGLGLLGLGYYGRKRQQKV